MIDVIQNELTPHLEEKIKILQNNKDLADYSLSVLADMYGVGKTNIPNKYLLIYRHYKDLSILTDTLIDIIELNIEIKQETVKEIRNKDVDAVIMAANDEDRITVVILWHEERLMELLERQEEIIQYLSDARENLQ
ncbi:MAG: hypothetical protein COU90_04755 [Candidatus Ryanbacteria bacterium CG10_big_fil_rev_8_21_14_0_10_43_42]|uniref:Uncharacterized protein n=1 Tax=Candidatus Ryanbacteria bacterium CG10_big_fil_rev_8_21_14_0_10_43_42 TaxID=1974864 RepID=A0A2M8KW71_9BACT|nr:MAG: hypothetical protein COU90_04755 [Candidatus Ryanbacteria bacterium CG10_big_fil_rev_8_21_14_0_10_43_42]